MKKYLILASAALAALSACTSESLVDTSAVDNSPTADNVMGFNVKNKNMTRAEKSLESTGQYNFGVWAIKQSGTSQSFTYQNVMENYLVGYHSEGEILGAHGYATKGSTWGQSDNLNDATSLWFYEGLGHAEYVNNPGTANGYFIWNKGESTTLDSNTDKMSIHANQYLKYWDYSSNMVDFYAYAPYVNGDDAPTLSEDKKLTIKNFSTSSNFMVAQRTYAKNLYKTDVTLSFMRLLSDVGIKFWDDVPGYDVEIISYNCDADADVEKVAAYGSIVDATSGTLVYDFANGTSSIPGAELNTVEWNFELPTIDVYDIKDRTGMKRIGRYNSGENASASETVYHPIPSNTNEALKFHVSFRLHSLDTNETIDVWDATVVVPTTYTRFVANTAYTYIFRITQDANGYTGGSDDPHGLYPIVFDKVVVADMSPEGDVYEISATKVTLGSATLTYGYTEGVTTNKVTATVSNLTSDASDKVYFTSTFENVATVQSEVNATGTIPTLTATANITAVGAGTTVINAWSNGVKTTTGCVVKVPLTLTDDSVAVGNKVTPANNLPANGGTRTWTSNNTEVATVNTTTGEVTGVAAGTATITLKYTDARGVEFTDETCTVTVTE